MTRLGGVIQFLRSTGLKDIEFIVINSHSASKEWPEIFSLANQFAIHAYQESEHAPVWNWLNGSSEDIFIYDR